MAKQWTLHPGKARGPRLSERIVKAFQAVLPATTAVKLLSADGPWAELKISKQRVRAQWLSTGIPSEVRLLDAQTRRPDVVLSRQLSPGAKQALSELRIGWVDESGAAEVVLGSIIISRSGRPQPRGPRRAERWSPAVLSVAEALLCGVQATVDATREATGFSGGACGNALRFLTDTELLTAEAARGPTSGRRIRDKNAFLSEYATHATVRADDAPRLVLGVTWRDPVRGLIELGRRWTAQEIPWVATGAVASVLMAPLLTTVGAATVYVDAKTIAGLESIAERSALRPIEGGRLTIMPFPTTTTHLLAQTIDDVRVAPWPRVYADLRVTGVRGEEAAEHVREVMDERRA